jgi:hypothetical protein
LDKVGEAKVDEVHTGDDDVLLVALGTVVTGRIWWVRWPGGGRGGKRETLGVRWTRSGGVTMGEGELAEHAAALVLAVPMAKARGEGKGGCGATGRR